MNIFKNFHLLSVLPVCHSFMSTFTSTLKITGAAASRLTAAKSDYNLDNTTICLGFVGDVMLGRGIDAILPHHVDGTIHESYMKHASGYVDLAIQHNGPLNRDELQQRGNNYIWGGDLMTLFRIPDVMVANLETALTTSNDYAKCKGINYRAHPSNVESLRAFGPDCIVTLANNHVLDWGIKGLKQTILTLDEAQIKHTGAGCSINDAMTPASATVKNMKVSVVAAGLPSAGVPKQWKAEERKCGVFYIEDSKPTNAKEIIECFQKFDTHEDMIKVVSLHMGPNWNDEIPDAWRDFAHVLIDFGVDVVVVHSSHHVKGIEVYRNKMISYGLGDFLNDYEGITGQGYESYRQDLTCLYLPRLKSNGELEQIDIIPCQIKHLKVQRTTNRNDIEWICATLSREGKKLGTCCEIVTDQQNNINLRIKW